MTADAEHVEGVGLDYHICFGLQVKPKYWRAVLWPTQNCFSRFNLNSCQRASFLEEKCSDSGGDNSKHRAGCPDTLERK